MKQTAITLGGTLAALGLAACTAGQTGPPPVTSVNTTSTAQSTVQIAVGTANVAGVTGMNVVAMLRQANGSSGVLVSTPKLTGSFTLPAAVAAPDGAYDPSSTADEGPSTDEVTNKYIGGSPQTLASATAISLPYTTFGTAGGLFGNGFAPSNYTSSGVPFSFNPYNEPLYAGTDPLASFVPWGGPPAFDPLGTGTGTTGTTSGGTDLYCETISSGACTPFPGIPLGLNVFAGVTPAAGTYNLAVTVPTGTQSSGVVTATTSLGAPIVLGPAAVTGAVYTPDPSGTGQDAAIAYTLPAGVTNGYVQVSDLGPIDPDVTPGMTGYPKYDGACDGGIPTYFTFNVTASGTSTITNAYGANAPKGPAICGATDYATSMKTSAGGAALPSDTIQVTVIGFDYNQFALQYSAKSGSTYPQKPTLPASADVTLSPIFLFPAPAAAAPTSTRTTRSRGLRSTR